MKPDERNWKWRRFGEILILFGARKKLAVVSSSGFIKNSSLNSRCWLRNCKSLILLASRKSAPWQADLSTQWPQHDQTVSRNISQWFNSIFISSHFVLIWLVLFDLIWFQYWFRDECRTWPGSVKQASKPRTHLKRRFALFQQILPPAPTKTVKRRKADQRKIFHDSSLFTDFLQSADTLSTHSCIHVTFHMDSEESFRLVIKLLFYFLQFRAYAEGGNSQLNHQRWKNRDINDINSWTSRQMFWLENSCASFELTRVHMKLKFIRVFEEFFSFVETLKSFSFGALWAPSSYVEKNS